MRTLQKLSGILAAALVSAAAVSAQAPAGAPNQDQPEFIRQGQALLRQGKLEDALALYRQVLAGQASQSAQNLLAANIAAGNVLDLLDRGSEAREYFVRAIEVAPSPKDKAAAQRATAISYAFEGDCKKASEYEQLVFDYFVSTKDYFQQGETANEAGRICIDAGDPDTAYKWYETGHTAGLREPDIKPDRKDLWEFRWEHALARIAARRGKPAEAQKHAAAAKAALDKGTNPQQAQFFPYLLGYVAFYHRDYKTALEEFQQANQNDPFIQCMIGQSYDKMGEKDKAIEVYRKASTTTAHNPPGAYAHRVTKANLSLKSNSSEK